MNHLFLCLRHEPERQPSPSACFTVDNPHNNSHGTHRHETRIPKMFRLYNHPETNKKVLVISGVSFLYSTLIDLMKNHRRKIQAIEEVHTRKTRESEARYQEESAPIWKFRAIIRYVMGELRKTWVTSNGNRGFSFYVAGSLTCLQCGHNCKRVSGALLFRCSRCRARQHPNGHLIIHNLEMITDMLHAVGGICSTINSTQFVKITWDIMHGSQMF